MPDDARTPSLDDAADSGAGVALPDAEHFVRRYYLLTGPDDLAGRPRETLTRIARNHLSLGAHRQPNETRLRVFTPRRDADGWQAPCSIVEIVTDDMPFLLDSTTSALASMGIGVREVVHPILRVRRDAAGNWLGLAEEDTPGDTALKESFIHIEIDEQPDDAALAELARHLTTVLADVRAAVGDWDLMRAKVGDAAEYLSVADLPVPDAERDEAVAFLNWLADDNFTLLGYREYKLIEDADGLALAMLPASGLGILRDPNRRFLRDTSGSVRLPAEIAPLVLKPEAMIVTKSSVRATVHRTTHMDHIGVKVFGPDGRVAGERRIIGLFTSSAYHRSARQIPLIRRKVRQVAERAGFAANSHDSKALANILEMFPRDELFQLDPAELYDMAVGILRLETRPGVKLFFRRDPFGRFLSVLAYIPRERFETALRVRISEMLETALGGPVTVISTAMGESPLARVHVFVQTDPGHLRDADFDALQAGARLAARTWDDDLADALAAAYAEDQGKPLFRRYAGGFSASYREAFTPADAVDDIRHIERLTADDPLGFRLGRDRDDAEDAVHFKLYRLGPLIPLSDCLPVLENLGFRVLEERPFSISRRGDADDVSVHEFVLADAAGQTVDVDGIAQPFAQAFARIWNGDAENDGFNRLVVRAGLGWRDVVLLRACAKYLRQAGVSFSQAYVEDTLVAHPDTARELVALFRARFDPAADERLDARDAHAIVGRIEAQIDTVSSLDEDRILRRYANLIGAMVRTNFFQPAEDGGLQPTLSFKLDSQRVDGLPAPRPMFEVFVYSPRFEAIHLRGGRVARGGIRWSDRREDFRTEILALMKAQQVKNAVIVPVGAKGGFVPKRLPAGDSRDAIQAEAVACYRLFMDALLDLTDTIHKGTLTPPRDVVRHDGDDPYLVVAADKGTATFSDIANGIAEEHGYWLGDAFASGGSAGYDHKEMGITARGAWESVKRHFYEMGLDTQTEPFRAVGVGDMSGDVFGNGMLRSECTRLVAAFDHRHIFIDPDPDPAASFIERRRLYDLPRSSWGDYDTGLISQGGGVFPRTAKTIPLSPEMQGLTGLDAEHATPTDLIRALLTADVDLLWFGGIGTYVKAADESHADAGDRANDGVRVDGRQLRARVVGEGANLACTQRGRIEYAGGGGRINMDAIDNAAGVDCSDHEVNIKIALRPAVEDERLTLEARNALLTDMTDDVAALVLRDNVLQSRAISLEQHGGRDARDWLLATMRALEREGRLDRAVEYLPGEEELSRRATAGDGLTRPEIAILLSYAKLALNDALIQDTVPDEPHFLPDLEAYFPQRLHEGFPDLAGRHPLHREIVATVLANEIVNRCGIAFVTRLREESGAEAGDVARAYALTRAAFRVPELWAALDSHDLRLPAGDMLSLYAELRDFMHRQTLWVLRNLHHPIALDAALDTFVPDIAQLSAGIEDVMTGAVAEATSDHRTTLGTFGLSPELARALANLRPLDSAFDIVQAAQGCGRPVPETAHAYFQLGAVLGLDRLKSGIARIETEDHWESRALQAEVEDLYAAQRALTAEALSGAPDQEAKAAVRRWLEREDAGIARAQRALADLEASGPLTLPKFTLAGRLLRGLTGT